MDADFLCQDLEAKLFKWFESRLDATKIKRRSEMTAMELYELLNKTDLRWDVVEIFEGARVLRFEVEEESDEVVQDKYGQ